MAFNINAQVILTGPKNIKAVTSQIQQQLQGINANVQVNVPKNSSQQIKKLNQGMTSASSSAKNLGTSAQSAGRSLNKVGTSAKNAGGAMQLLGKETALTFKRFAAAGIVTATFFRLTSAISEAVPKALEFQREMVKLQQVTGKTAKEVAKVGQATRNLSLRLGIDANELASVARIFAQAGQTLAQVQDSLKAVARSALAPTFGSMEQTAEGLIASLNQFNISASESEKVLGALNRVSKKFAVESSDLIAAIRRAGGVFAISAGHMTEPIEALEQFAAIFTSVRATTRESAETIATGLRTIFTRMQRRGTIEALASLGVQLTDTEGKFVGIYEGFRRISHALDTMIQQGDALTLSAITEELGGIRQMGKLVPALQNFAKAEAALVEARKGAAEGLGPDVAKGLTPLIKQFELLQARFSDFIRTIADSSTFKVMAKMAMGLANAFLKIGETLAPLLPMITALMMKKGTQMFGGFMTGFMGGFGKGPGMGASMGGALSGASGAKQQVASATVAAKITQLIATSNNQLSQLQTVNTNLQSMQGALTGKLQEIVIAVRQGGRSFGGRKGFASGGLVGGSGSGDTVPAMLSPGEFVIRKSSVGKFGSGNLDDINRYGKGGMVLWKTDDSEYGGLYARPRQKSEQSSGTISAVMNKKSGSKEVLAMYGDPISYLVSKGSEDFFEKEVSDNFRTIISNMSETLAGQNKVLNAGKMADDIEEEIGIADITGKVFEGVIKNVANSFHGQTSTATFDIPRDTVKDSAALNDLFGEGGKGIPTTKDYDAKIAANRKLRLSVMDKAIKEDYYDELALATFGGTYGHYTSKQLMSMPKGKKDKTTKMTVQAAAINQRLDEFQTAKVKAKSLMGEADKAALGKMIVRINDQARLLTEKLPMDSRKQRPVIRAAAGGSISGSDTVPALLTPGEYVINKKSAQNYGYGNLKDINKYAKGGPVRFGGGGKMGSGGGGMASGADLQLAIGNLAGGMTGMLSTITMMKTEGLSFATALNLATSGAMLFAAVNTLNIGALKKTVGSFVTGFQSSLGKAALNTKMIGASGSQLIAGGVAASNTQMIGASGDWINTSRRGIDRAHPTWAADRLQADLTAGGPMGLPRQGTGPAYPDTGRPKDWVGQATSDQVRMKPTMPVTGAGGFMTGVKGALGSVTEKFKGTGKKAGWLGKRMAGLGKRFRAMKLLVSNAAVPLGVLAVAAVAAVATFFILKKAGDALVDVFSGIGEKTESWATKGKEGRKIMGRKDATVGEVKGNQVAKEFVTIIAMAGAVAVGLTIAHMALSAAAWAIVWPIAALAAAVLLVIMIFKAFMNVGIEAARQEEFMAYQRLGTAADAAAISLERLAEDTYITSSELMAAARAQAGVQANVLNASGKSADVIAAEAWDSSAGSDKWQKDADVAERIQANRGWMSSAGMVLKRMGDLGNIVIGGAQKIGYSAVKGGKGFTDKSTYTEEREAQAQFAQADLGAESFLMAVDAVAEKLGDDLGAEAFGQNLDRAFKQAITRVDTEFLKNASVDLDDMNAAMVEAGLSTQAMTKALVAERDAKIQAAVAEAARDGSKEGKRLATNYVIMAQEARKYGKTLSAMSTEEIKQMMIRAGHTRKTIHGEEALSMSMVGSLADIDRLTRKEKELQENRQRTSFIMTKLGRAASLAVTAVEMLVTGFSRLAQGATEASGILDMQMSNAQHLIKDAGKSVQSYAAQLNVFKNLESSSEADIQSATRQTLSQAGITDEKTVSGISETVELRKALPDILQQATADIALTPQLETPQQIFESLGKTAKKFGVDFSILPEAITEELKGSIAGIMDRQGGEINIEEIFRTMLNTEEFQKLQDAMSKSSGAITEAMGTIQENLEKASAAFVSVLRQEVAIIQAGIASRQKEQDIMKTVTDALSKFEPGGGKKTVAQAAAEQARRQQAIYGGDIGGTGIVATGTTDIAAQMATVQRLTDENLTARRALATAGGPAMGLRGTRLASDLGPESMDEEAIRLGKEARERGVVDTGNEEEALRKNTIALEHERAALQALLSSTDKLTAIQNELAAAAKSRMTARELVQADMNKFAEAAQIKDPVKRDAFLEEAFRGRTAFSKFQAGEDMTDKEFQALSAGGLEEGIKIAMADPDINLDEKGAEDIRKRYFEFLERNYGAMNVRAGTKDQPVFKDEALDQNLRIANRAATTTTDAEEALKQQGIDEGVEKQKAQKMLDELGISGMKAGLDASNVALGIFKENIATAGAKLKKIIDDVASITAEAREIRESGQDALDNISGATAALPEGVTKLAQTRNEELRQAEEALSTVAAFRGERVAGELDPMTGATLMGGVTVEDLLGMTNAQLVEAGVGTEADVVEIVKILQAIKDRGEVTEEGIAGGERAGEKFGGGLKRSSETTEIDANYIAKTLAKAAAIKGIISEGKAESIGGPEGSKIFNALMENNAKFREFVDEATTPGSIYVHDTHAEKLQKAMKGELESQLTVMKKGESGEGNVLKTVHKFQKGWEDIKLTDAQKREGDMVRDMWREKNESRRFTPEEISGAGGTTLAQDYRAKHGEQDDAWRRAGEGQTATGMTPQRMADEERARRFPNTTFVQPARIPPARHPLQPDLPFSGTRNASDMLSMANEPMSEFEQQARQGWADPNYTGPPALTNIQQGFSGASMGGLSTAMEGGNMAEFKAMVETLNRVADGLVISISVPPMEVVLNTAGFTDQMTNIVTKLALDAMGEQLPVMIEDRKTEVIRALGMENA